MSDRCAECGGLLLWGDRGGWMSHTPGHHAVRRKLLLRAAWRLMREELVLRHLALDAGACGRVVVLWRLVLPTEVKYSHAEIPGDVWDHMDHESLLGWMQEGLCAMALSRFGIRPHPKMVKHRVLDERARGIEDVDSGPS